jgi:hypothetical protein
MKSHLLLMRIVLETMGTRCCASTTRDLKTITSRCESEGLSFLTITLPNFCKEFERALDEGMVFQSNFAGYAKKGCLPKFLSGFTEQVFHNASGRLLDEPSIEAIQAVRQITRLFSKLNLECSDARKSAAIDKFVECEKQLRVSDASLAHSDMERFRKMSRLLFGDQILSKLDRKIWSEGITPKHGPGSTADKLSGNEKWNQREWTERLEQIFPYQEFLFPNILHYLEDQDTVLLEPGAERPVRVITVPKTLKTPRIIAIEPTCMQYMQQGIMQPLVDLIQRDDFLGQVIGFNDQDPNREMARLGSLTGSLATLDLSEASDRVSNQLVRNMVAPYVWLATSIDATRSRKADVPGHGVIRLAKFASMGSALCFPIEAMVFTTIVFLGIQQGFNRPLNRKELCEEFAGKVRIFGDDIVVPTEYARSVVMELEAFGFLVNRDKSFWTGKFRESCGKEYFNGHDVSVVKAKEALPTSRRHVKEIISSVSLRNLFYMNGDWDICKELDPLLKRVIPFPTVKPESPALGRHTLLEYETRKVCKFLHRPLVKAYVVHSRLPSSELEGPGALLKWFLKEGDLPFADPRHLERAGRPDAVDIKLRWVCPY